MIPGIVAIPDPVLTVVSGAVDVLNEIDLSTHGTAIGTGWDTGASTLTTGGSALVSTTNDVRVNTTPGALPYVVDEGTDYSALIAALVRVDATALDPGEGAGSLRGIGVALLDDAADWDTAAVLAGMHYLTTGNAERVSVVSPDADILTTNIDTPSAAVTRIDCLFSFAEGIPVSVTLTAFDSGGNQVAHKVRAIDKTGFTAANLTVALVVHNQSGAALSWAAVRLYFALYTRS